MSFGPIKQLILTAGLAAGLLGWSSDARADGVVICNGCNFSGYQAAAKGQGEGYVYVIDYTNKRLRLYEVIEEWSGYRTAAQMPVNAALQNTFLLSRTFVSGTQTTITVPIEAGDPPYGSYFVGDPLAPFVENGVGAFEIANNVTIRSGVEAALATRFETGNSTVDGLTMMLTSIIFNSTSVLTGEALSFTIVITWEDGSKTTFKLDSDNLTKAEYQPGESVDADGNPVPDSAVQDPNIAPEFAGVFDFGSQETFEDFIENMRARGVPITGPQNDQQRSITCVWTPSTGELRCFFN